jgi:hypothetical protein
MKHWHSYKFHDVSMKYTTLKINYIFLLISALEKNNCAVQHCQWTPELCKYCLTISTEIQDKQEKKLAFTQIMKNWFYFYKYHCSLKGKENPMLK